LKASEVAVIDLVTLSTATTIVAGAVPLSSV
jgi:hypothetical protein